MTRPQTLIQFLRARLDAALQTVSGAVGSSLEAVLAASHVPVAPVVAQQRQQNRLQIV